ncbi:MAG: AraC family transcriptional regulator [Oscillospiraceae bacterium]|nr:AraC family transcriptional regulator [Oscillospiraceae bacterium]
MSWIEDTQKAINYIEDNLLEDVSVENAAKYIYSSIDRFQKMFLIVTGYSVSEYIRNRKLSLAGQELAGSRSKVIDVALKYGYETPESFTKAFTRFHGFNPSKIHIFKNQLKCFAPLAIQINITGGFIMSRKLIPNVEKIYEVKSENYMFPSCMRSAMSALNENAGYDFMFFAGVTGDLFTQTWCSPKWQYNDSYSNVCKETQMSIRAAFDACGYEYDYIAKEAIEKDKSSYVKKIVDSIDRGVPVLSFGIVGPPICSIICGYDENGDILIGWSQFTDEHKDDIPTDLVCSDDYFQVRNGLDKSEALIFIGRKKETPDIADSIKQSLLNIPQWAAFPPMERVCFGRQAFEAWADSLLDDECFADESMLDSPLDTYGSCVVQTGTNMHYIQDYLKRAAELCPDMNQQIEQLKQAYIKERDALDAVTKFQGGYFFDADKKALLSKEFRITLAKLVRKIGQCFDEAAIIFN